MRLKKPCIHDCYDRHWPNLFEAVVCPGGEFLPEGALKIWWCEEHRMSQYRNAQCLYGMQINEPTGFITCRMVPRSLVDDTEHALASQVGESE